MISSSSTSLLISVSKADSTEVPTPSGKILSSGDGKIWLTIYTLRFEPSSFVGTGFVLDPSALTRADDLPTAIEGVFFLVADEGITAALTTASCNVQ